MEVLGNGTNRAFVASRDGRALLAEVPASSLSWGRALCALSSATVQVAPARCAGLTDVRTWAHSLVIYRDNERVWEGPIRRRVDSRTGLQLTAIDVLGWLERRPLRTARVVTDSPVVTEMEWALVHGLTPDDPNVLPHAQTIGGTGGLTDVEAAAGEKYALDLLSDAVADGGRWTALGRRVLLWDHATSIGTTRELSPEDHLQADVEVIEDGDLLATQVVARNDEGVVAATPATPDPFYGLVGLLTPSGAARPAGVLRTATRALNRWYPAPQTIAVPDGAALRCDAPFPISALVPGVAVPVSTTTATARRLTAGLVLTGVSVSQDSAGETVGITLSAGGDL